MTTSTPHGPTCDRRIRPVRTFGHLVGLAAELRRRCDYLADHPEVVKGAVGFHWAAKHRWQPFTATWHPFRFRIELL